MMLYGSVGAVIALVLNIVLSFWVLGIDPIEMMFSSFHQSLEQLTVYYREHGMSEADIKKTVDGYAEMLRMMRIIMPGAFMMCAPLMAFVNYMAAKRFLRSWVKALKPSRRLRCCRFPAGFCGLMLRLCLR